MNSPRIVFADTSFYLAVFWRRDPRHRRALAWQRWIAANGLRIVTTEAVLWEMLNSLSPHQVRRPAFAAYQRIHGDPRVDVVDFDLSLRDAAIDKYQAFHDKDWGIVDCFSFSLMEQRRLTHALTADKHFVQAGFIALLMQDPP